MSMLNFLVESYIVMPMLLIGHLIIITLLSFLKCNHDLWDSMMCTFVLHWFGFKNPMFLISFPHVGKVWQFMLEMILMEVPLFFACRVLDKSFLHEDVAFCMTMDYDPINQLIVFIVQMLWCSMLINQLIDTSCCHSSMFLCCTWWFAGFPSSGLVSIFNKQTCPLDWWKHKLIWVAAAVWLCLLSNALINWSMLIVVHQSLPIDICRVSQ